MLPRLMFRSQTLRPRLAGVPALVMPRRMLTVTRTLFMTDGEQHIYDKLHGELQPTKLSVTDSSGGCGSMYVVEIEAECFRGLNRVKQTKMVNGLLKSELKDMHGMRVLCTVPPEKA